MTQLSLKFSLGWLRLPIVALCSLMMFFVFAPSSNSASSQEKPSTAILAQIGESNQIKVSPDPEVPASKYTLDLTMHTKQAAPATDLHVTYEFSTLDLVDGSYQAKVPAWGKWDATLTYLSNENTQLETENWPDFAVRASHYNIVALNASFPVATFTLGMFTSLNSDTTTVGAGGPDLLHTPSGEEIPTVFTLERPAQINFAKLPEYVYPLPTIPKDLISTQVTDPLDRYFSYRPAFQEYVASLYEISPDAKFHFFGTDIFPSVMVQLIYLNRLPSDAYDLNIISDGSWSYYAFRNNFSGNTLAENQEKEAQQTAQAQELISALRSGTKTSITDDEVPYIWAFLKAEGDRARYLVVRPKSLVSPNDNNEFGQSVASSPQLLQVNLNSQLTKLTTADDPGKTTAFKQLYNLSNAFFANNENKKPMLILGTWVTSEHRFESYVRIMQKLYPQHKLYYKGHPHTPTVLYPEKQQQLTDLGLTDVDSTIPAELLLFFNKDLYLSGYSTSTFSSVANPEVLQVLFGKTKAAAQEDPNGTKEMKVFLSEIDDQQQDPAVLAAKNSGQGDILVEFNNPEPTCMWAIYNETTDTLTCHSSEPSTPAVQEPAAAKPASATRNILVDFVLWLSQAVGITVFSLLLFAFGPAWIFNQLAQFFHQHS